MCRTAQSPERHKRTVNWLFSYRTEKCRFARELIGGPCGADLESAKAAAKTRAAKKNAARKAKKAAEGEAAPSVASVTNGLAKAR